MWLQQSCFSCLKSRQCLDHFLSEVRKLYRHTSSSASGIDLEQFHMLAHKTLSQGIRGGEFQRF